MRGLTIAMTWIRGISRARELSTSSSPWIRMRGPYSINPLQISKTTTISAYKLHLFNHHKYHTHHPHHLLQKNSFVFPATADLSHRRRKDSSLLSTPPLTSLFCTSSDQEGASLSANKLKNDRVEIIYFRGLPQITVPLPSRRERCRFIVKPLTNTVGDLSTMIRHEDKGVDRLAFISTDGVRIAASNTIEMLMEHDFDMVINDDLYHVTTPPQEKPSQEDLTRLSSVRNLVGQLYGALNVDEHQLRQERDMLIALEKLKNEVGPLENKREQINQLALKRTNNLTWAGLGFMSVQFGILARLTWWEYSWDIMEPVTYFVTYGTALLSYAYFVLTKQDYVLPEVADRQYLITFHKNAKKVGLDVNKYNNLKDKIHKIETDLRRLRDPLALHLPFKNRIVTKQDLDDMIHEVGSESSQSMVSKATQRISEIFKKSS